MAEQCFDNEPILGCFRPNDNTLQSASVLIHVIYQDGISIGQAYTLADTETPIDPATYLGGGVVSVGDCDDKQVECVESQEWTYAIDNTGTQTNEDATLTITLSDGSSFTINQTDQGAASQWTPQMAEWGANIQAAADSAGLAWFVDVRYIVADSSNLSGGGGFSGPPSESIAAALYAGGMRARYVNIQICPGQPVPVSAVYNSATRPNLNMTTAGAVLGPLQKFYVCRSCGEMPVWYLADGVTPATAGQIPNCYEPCGTLALADAPPDRDCEFDYSLACDDNGQTDPVNFTNQVTRRATICSGEQIAVDYFVEDPTDPNALIEYTLVGDFVDCDTGEPLPLPCVENEVHVDTEAVCVDLGDGCNVPAFRIVRRENCQETETFVTEDGDVTDQIVTWKAGACNQNRAYIDSCWLYDQYAIQWMWGGNGDLASYDASTDTTTYYGQLPQGGFALAFKNDTVEPTLYFQRAGEVYKASPDDPIGTFTLVGTNSLPSFPCFDFDPSGRLLAGDGNRAYEIDPDTGAAVFLGNLIDARDGANLSVGPGDWFFDPNGVWYMMARDNRGASFNDPNGNPYCTGTALWKIDPVSLEATRVNNSCAPVSGTGASWLAAGQYLLSTSSGAVYVHNTYTETWDVLYNADNNDQGANVTVNDLAAQWIIPDPIRVFGWVDTDCAAESCNPVLYTLEQDEATFDIMCVPFEPQLAGKFGPCEAEPNPFVSDPFSPSGGGSGGCETCPDQQWHMGCSDAGSTLWRVGFDAAGNEVREYLYGGLTEPVTTAPPNFDPRDCESIIPPEETVTPFCVITATPNQTIYRKEDAVSGDVTWFDESGTIPAPDPADIVPGACEDDALLPTSEQVICLDGSPAVRLLKETYITNADGLPELSQYQLIYFDENGPIYDSGVLNASDPLPPGEPTNWYIGDCQPQYVEIAEEKLCEIDARFLLLIDSGGVFGRYSFYSKTWETVSTLSVSSAGGSADVENFLLYNFVSPDQMTVIDVNTDTQLPNVTLIDGVINPNVATNPKTFSAASFREADGYLYAQDTGGADAGLYRVNVATGEVDFVTTITGVSGTGTSIAIDNTTDTLYVNGSNLSYQVDWVTGVATQVANPPIQPNGSTFDTDGNWYVTQGNDTYVLPAGADGNDPDNWNQIIDDFTAGANSIAYYEVVAPQPSCFKRRFGIAADGSKTIIGDFNIADDSPRTIVGDIDCCECSCGGGSGGSGGVSDVTVQNADDIGQAVENANTYKGPTAQEIAEAIVNKQRDVTPGVFTWINETNVQSLPVPAGSRGELVSIEDFGTGFVRWSIDGSDPTGGDDNEFTTTGPYHAAYALKNVPLDLVRLNGSSTGSDFSVAWLIYN